MDHAHFAAFHTALGPCAIAWTGQGVRAIQLPCRNPSATESSLLGVGGDNGGLQLGLLVATISALAAAVPLWLPPVSRYLADAAAGRSDAHAEERARAAG